MKTFEYKGKKIEIKKTVTHPYEPYGIEGFDFFVDGRLETIRLCETVEAAEIAAKDYVDNWSIAWQS
jgi:hypothetical protein